MKFKPKERLLTPESNAGLLIPAHGVSSVSDMFSPPKAATCDDVGRRNTVWLNEPSCAHDGRDDSKETNTIRILFMQISKYPGQSYGKSTERSYKPGQKETNPRRLDFLKRAFVQKKVGMTAPLRFWV